VTPLNFIESALAKLDQREADTKLAYEQAMAALPMERLLARRMPTDIDCHLKDFSVRKQFLCGAAMRFRASSRGVALQLLEHFVPLPVVLAQSYTTCFCPQSRVSEVTKDDPRYELTDVAPLLYRCSSFGETVRWWTDIEGMVVSVDVELAEGTDRARVWPLHSQEEVARGVADWQYIRLPQGKLMEFGGCSKDSSGDVNVHWLPTDDYKALFLLNQDHRRRSDRAF